jgi:prepilin-type N-terminal cleavage/methylation domain-containing protein/prepilin-type processing-associated H-X9-DG protein
MISEEFILEVKGKNIITRKRRGFTLIELLVVIAIIALLMAILMPALRRAQEQGERAACLNSLKQLVLAWVMYADTNDDKIVNGAPLSNVAPTAGFHANELPWVGVCWHANYEQGVLLSVEDQIKGIKAGALWPYLKNIGLYKCPNSYRGEMMNYSIVDSMNGTVRGGTIERLVFKVRTQIRTPADRIVFVDEGQMTPDSYAVNYDKETWWDDPPVRHGDGVTFGFADGHSDYWKWKGRDTVKSGKSHDRTHPQNDIKPTTPEGFRDLYKFQKAVWGKLGYTPSVPP